MNKSLFFLAAASVCLSFASAGCIRPTEIITIAPVTVEVSLPPVTTTLPPQTVTKTVTVTAEPTPATTIPGKIVVIYSETASATYSSGGAFFPGSPNYAFLIVSYNISNQGYEYFPFNAVDFKVVINSIQYDRNPVAANIASTSLLYGNRIIGELVYTIPWTGTLAAPTPASFTPAYAGSLAYNIEWVKAS